MLFATCLPLLRRKVGVAAGGFLSLFVAVVDAMLAVKTIAVMLLALIVASVIGVFAQQATTATTEDGRKIIGMSDGGEAPDYAEMIKELAKMKALAKSQDSLYSVKTPDYIANYISDPAERDFSPEEELKYQLRDKLGHSKGGAVSYPSDKAYRLSILAPKRKAAELYQKAADQGDPNAETNLGWLYHEGKGVPQDYHKAVELFQKAADQGYAVGQAYLASAYADGKGVPRDYSKAIDLLHKALDQGPYANVFNDFAWFLATCPDAAQRNGKQAVEYATKACELTQWKEANFIGTLAAAYAEIGDFDAAIKYQKQAMELGSDYPDRQQMERSIELYWHRKPYRE
jgi:TPR repeat protein